MAEPKYPDNLPWRKGEILREYERRGRPAPELPPVKLPSPKVAPPVPGAGKPAIER